VGLGNVDNTSDTNKPISSATQSALDGKAATSHTHTASQVTDFNTAAAAAAPVQSVNGNTGTVTVAVPSASTATPQALGTAAAGTSADYSRADHIHAAPALNDLSNVSAATPSDNDVLVFDTATGNWVAEAPSGGSNMTGATTSAAGTAGLVPAPAAGNPTRALHSNGIFEEVALYPNYKGSGTWLRSPLTELHSATNVSSVTNLLRRFVIMFAPADGTIGLLGLRYPNAVTTGYNINLAIWQMGETGLPSTYIDGGNISVLTGVGNTEYTLVVNAPIKRGYFWVSHTANATENSGAFATFNIGASTNVWWLGATQTNNNGGAANTAHSYTCGTAYDQTTHESSFSLSTGSVPQIAYQYA